MKKRVAPTYRNKSEQISAALIERILASELKPGDPLGTEAELLGEHDVSRPTLREGLRMLEAQGIVSLRPGPGGGATVSRPSIDSLAHALSVFLYLRNVPFGMVLTAREIIEPALACEAALHGSEEDFAEMARSIERMRAAAGQEDFLRENRRFHELVARSSRNQVLESFWAAISLLASGEQHGITYSFGNRMHVIEAHEAILQACRARDSAAAAQRMATHVGELENLVRHRYRALLEEPTRMLTRTGIEAAMIASSFRHATPALRVYYGEDCLNQLAAELERAGCSRAVVFCGRSVAQAPDGLAPVRAALGERCAGVFDGVQAHSPLPAVLAGVAALRLHAADAVIALGGGSAVVTARAAAILLAEEKDIHELCTRFEPGRPPVSPRLARPKLPQFAVPTTPTTAYAKAGTAVLNPALHRRLTMFDPKTRAQALFFHPALSLSAPAPLAQDAGLNALVMAIQGLESPTRDPLADALLLHAVRLLHDHLPALGAAADSADTRGALMMAALLAGQGTDYTGGGGLASVIGHCIGARFALGNGVTNAILLPHTIRFNAPATVGRLTLAAEIFGAASPISAEDAAGIAGDRAAAFFAALGLPPRLRDVGVTAEALPLIAADAGTDWFLFQNPRKIADPAELIEVLRAAW